MGYLLLLSQGLYQGAGLKVEDPGLELANLRDTSVASGNLIHCATIPIPPIFIVKIVIYLHFFI